MILQLRNIGSAQINVNGKSTTKAMSNIPDYKLYDFMENDKLFMEYLWEHLEWL